MRLKLVTVLLTLGLSVVAMASARVAEAANDCRFRRTFQTWTLRGDCTTDETIVINAARLDGDGHTITARDPATPGVVFTGAIVRNGGDVLHVRDIRLTTDSLDDACHAGLDLLRGVLLDGASGSVTDSVIFNVKQGDSGCQEGHAIDVRNMGTSPRQSRVRIEGNRLSGYQKTGVLVIGDVDALVVDNVIDGGGPVGFIARNGIQIGFGADARVSDNRVTGNSYTGTSTVATGVLVVGGPLHGGAFTRGVQVRENVILASDVGVLLDNSEADGSASLRPTRNEVVGNFIRHDLVTNGIPYHAGVTVIGNRDRVVGNRIAGAAYDPATIPGATFEVDDSLAIDPRVFGNR